MTEVAGKVQSAVRFIRGRVAVRPRVAIILGTGLGALAREIKGARSIPYSEIPGFPGETSVVGHEGQMVFGRIGKKDVVAMQGRFHYYEGYSMQDVTLPTRVMARLGARTLIVSNAAGGMNPQFRAGELMVITDHINLMGDNPLIGPHDERLGERFPDMSEPYNRKLIALVEDIALGNGIRLRRGVYVAVAGPCLETPAEYRFLRLIGADAVGMSTVPEVIVARQIGLRVLGVSCITDSWFLEVLGPVDIRRIIRTVLKSETSLTRLVMEDVLKL